MVEGAFAFPIIIFLLLAIFEITRYMTARGVLIAGAQRAVSLASVDPRLASKDPAERTLAFADLETAAKSVPTSLFIGQENSGGLVALAPHPQYQSSPVFIDVPVDKTTVYTSDPESLFENKVIRVSVAAQFKWLVPSIFGNFTSPLTIVTEAVSFREKRLGFSQPKPVNCKGETVNPGDNRNYWDQGCACPSNPTDPNVVYNPESSTCRCTVNNSNLSPGATCQCNGEFVLQGAPTEQKQCVCNKQGIDCLNIDPEYPGMGYLDPWSCTCHRCSYWGEPQVPDPATNYTSCKCTLTNQSCNQPGAPIFGTEPGPYYASAWCDCRSCGVNGGKINANGNDCDCSDVVCENNLHTTSYYACGCGCNDSGQDLINLAPYGQVCRPSSCRDGNCTYDPGTKTWTRNE